MSLVNPRADSFTESTTWLESETYAGSMGSSSTTLPVVAEVVVAHAVSYCALPSVVLTEIM